jgi:NADPH-dependent ferric siderophore reductase
MLLVGADGNRPVRRRYTIRALDPGTGRLAIDVVLHGDGPGERWVRAARPGTVIEGIAPRGKVSVVPAASWHLFVGDEAALPAVAVMAGALPAAAQGIVILEVPERADEQPVDTAAGLSTTWLHRDGRPAGEPGELVRAVRAAQLPPGPGHAYLAGEARVVLALREALAARGLAPEQLSPKAYWGRGRANLGHGEPARD